MRNLGHEESESETAKLKNPDTLEIFRIATTISSLD